MTISAVLLRGFAGLRVLGWVVAYAKGVHDYLLKSIYIYGKVVGEFVGNAAIVEVSY